MLGNVLPQQILVLDKGEDNHTVKFLLEDYTFDARLPNRFFDFLSK